MSIILAPITGVFAVVLVRQKGNQNGGGGGGVKCVWGGGTIGSFSV